MSELHDEHLSDDVWERLAMDELSPDQRAAALRHVTGCRECTAIYKGVLALEARAREAGLDGPPPRDAAVDAAAPARAARARPRWRLAVAGAALAAAAALIVWWQTRPAAVRDQPGVTRGPQRATITVHAPQGPPPRFDWQPVAGATGYRLTVFTDDGQPRWTQEVVAPPVAWPATTAAAPGAYRWKVEALGPAGVLATSTLGGFELPP